MERKQEQKCLFEVEMDGGNEHEKILLVEMLEEKSKYKNVTFGGMVQIEGKGKYVSFQW